MNTKTQRPVEPLVLLGNSGTGNTHLLIGLGTAAAEQGRRIKYMTTAARQTRGQINLLFPRDIGSAKVACC